MCEYIGETGWLNELFAGLHRKVILVMAHQKTIDMEVVQINSGQKTMKQTISAFRGSDPLNFSPQKLCPVAVVSPLQKNDSGKPDGMSLATSSPAHSSSRFEETTFEIQRHACARRRRATRFKPFSFDGRDAAQRVAREKRLQEIRHVQDQWCYTFKAHPVRRYKPLIQPPAHFKGRSEHVK